jgi:Holliday junction resolvasome RuvABC ATP-dependent DNA helicase subunit
MVNTQADKYKLFKIAVLMRNEFGYEPPKNVLPERTLTDEFANEAQAFAGQFYMSELSGNIAAFAPAHPELAADMLRFWVDYAANKRGGSLNSRIAEEGLRQMQQQGLLDNQMG